jgi:hypothetical protein
MAASPEQNPTLLQSLHHFKAHTHLVSDFNTGPAFYTHFWNPATWKTQTLTTFPYDINRNSSKTYLDCVVPVHLCSCFSSADFLFGPTPQKNHMEYHWDFRGLSVCLDAQSTNQENGCYPWLESKYILPECHKYCYNSYTILKLTYYHFRPVQFSFPCRLRLCIYFTITLYAPPKCNSNALSLQQPNIPYLRPVLPSWARWSGGAVCSRSNMFTSCTWPSCAASISGPLPSLSASSTRAPASSRTAHTSACPSNAA